MQIPARRRARALALAVLTPLVVVAGTLTGPVASGDAAANAQRTPYPEVWQVPQPPHPKNPANPLARRVWGVYEGPQDQVWRPYQAASGEERELIGRIALRPRTKWYGAFVPDGDIAERVRQYVESSQDGDPRALVQLAVFRMQPWGQQACQRPPTRKERRSYRTWISNLATGIGSAHTLVVMQPDGPFLWCVPKRGVTSRLLTFATKRLSALPNTSVYIDAGAADWCENGRGADPRRCAGILKRTGVKHARGFALDSTHYTGPEENIRHGTRIVRILQRAGYGRKHFIIDTAKSGNPMSWGEVIPAAPGEQKDNARTCSKPGMERCVTLGIPPTARAADPRWGMPPKVCRQAARHVDGFVWFGRPWLYYQADPFVKQRAVDMARTTPWMAPMVG
ncbi:glycoside hydrolase family 6 protein [Nocardioides sp.]|uniref:glycoside hydrolase family 6 protein n=1 Tax=Nocardioides sp. TaxID=35761 RepID=UPI00273543E4|nr:glycoside hydrolase family 6 protein [Nocardioides sp.]MDP3893309.1 glycoside hydrolase family 6 protein [Nocardioides sp.]